MTLADTITNYAGGSSRAAAMDEDAFQAIYDRTARPLWAYLLRVSGRRDVADDLLQEVYCRFFVRNPPGLDDAQTRSYLFRIATNLLRDRWRKRQEAQWPEGFDCGHAGDMDAQLDVRHVMKSLKPRERELLWLAYVEGMTHTEIATATGLTALSVRPLLFRARKRAASLLRPEGNSI